MVDNDGDIESGAGDSSVEPEVNGGLRERRAAARAKKKQQRAAAVAAQDLPSEGDDLTNLLLVLRAIRDGDFAARLSPRTNGIMSEIAEALNDVASINDRMAKEFIRVSRVVGREGRMTERASVGTVGGAWASELESINSLIGDLVRPTTEVARVIVAVAEGDLTEKMALEIEGKPVRGEFLRIGTTVNTMVDQLSSFAAEVTRVAREVGTEGKLGGQAEVPGVAGTWKDLTDNVNLMASNLTDQVRNIALVTTAVANGDLSQTITVDVKGEILELKNTINTMVDQLSSFADEVTRVAREVGTEGKLGGQAAVPGVAGTWKDLTDNVNLMASNLTDQVRNIALVTTAVANGDLSQKITVDVKGEILELKNTINTMVDQLRSFASEVTRVAREVGTEGELGGQADVPDVAGTWKDLTDSVNFMATNLTNQVRGIAKVVTAVANGDLSQKFVVEAKGEVAALADTINSMTDTLGIFADQVTGVAREVGTEGKLGGQASVPGAAGTWKDLTDNVNFMASNLTNQVRGIAKVVTAVANGDLSQKFVVEAKGEIAALADTINSMTDTLGIFADQVTGVAREVGTEGKLGGQAKVPGAAGTWKDLTDNVNYMASNLTMQVRGIVRVVTAVANGDLSQRLVMEAKGEIAALADTINSMTDTLGIFADQVTGVAREVGTEGKLGGQASVPGAAGTWKDLTDNVNFMASNLTNQVRGIAKVVTAVANGDLSQKFVVEAKGEIAALADTINSMTDTLGIFAEQVTTVAREVGTEGKLGGQASVPGAAGTWKDLTDNVNFMASNLTNQVRGIAKVVTAVANGDLSQKFVVEAKGEIAALADTINSMTDTLGIFAEQVTTVAREVGTEGKLGGQASVPGAAGTWKDLTDNVNFMAGNLTDQVRNIALVTTAVANGDLSRKITVDVKGEILELKNTINVMVDQLSSFAAEVTRVAKEVGTEGKLGGQADVPGVAGTWKDLTDNVNFMASNLTDQVRNIALVTTAVANGDLSRKITVDVKGEILELKNTINVMVDQLSSFAAEVTRVAKEVGTEGKLGGQADVPGVAGTWKDLTDNVNFMAGNLTDQVRNIALVTTAVANGDLSQKITVDVKGEILELKNTINTMVDQLRSFAAEVTRVAKEVGTEGKLGGQADVPGVAGTWKDLTDSVNFMASNLTDQVRDIALVTTAVANGDLSQKITVDVKGEILELKNTINVMVDQLSSFADEVTRVAREVGTEGKLGGQAEVPGVAGTWKDLTDNVNFMATNLTNQVRGIAKVVTAVANGDLSQKFVVEAKGEIAALADTINSMTDTLGIFAEQVTTVAREVGTEGKLGGQASVPGAAGTWKDLTDNVNFMAGNLTDQVRNIALVTTAVANGDLSRKITVDVKGEILELKNTINVMVDQLSSFAAEVTRVAKEVGTEGKLGGQADVPGVAGTWKDLTDNVNFMASNLTDQVRNIALVTTAVANGDLSRKITVDVKGEILELKNTINVMVDQLSSFAAEVTRVAKEVGTEGKLGGQADVPGVAGTWKDLTDNVNFMAGNLTDQVRNIALVTTAVANGDLSQKITVDVKGEILELKNTINVMVDQLRSFAAEVTRVAKEVGTEGKLGGQADVPGVAGTWKDLTDNVNYMATNLTDQVRNIALVTTAVANGDLSQKITVDVKGEILELKNTINVMVDQLRSFAAEVTRVAKEVGTEGKLAVQANVPGVAGTWKDLTDNVNYMASNLTDQVRNIALVTTAVANGDLSQKITVDVKGEILELKNTINVMVDQLRSFAAEVTRVAREVGTEGKLGGQANVPGVAGTWKDLTDNVNYMAGNLTDQVRNIALVTTAVANGDLSQKITVDVKGEILELKNTINVMVDQLRSFAAEVTRVAREVGTEGKLGGQANVPGVAGTWKDLTDNVNFMASNLTTQVRGIVQVVTAVANGDLSKKLVLEAKGEIAALADTINSMTDTLRVFADQVTSVAREVGIEGKLGGQARVPGAAGTWKDLTDNVNYMASNLTTQVRGIVRVVTAVANGDLSQRLVMEAKGEIAALADTINSMTDTLRVFADQVTGVAREVGIEGKLGGQASVPGAAGTWKDLTDNVNQLAGNLTAQVRAIAEVATAVTKGDLTRQITVEAQGELLDLKDNVNQMIANLKETTQKNMEQDWLKTNLAKFSGMMQGQKNLESVSRLIMSELTPLVSAHHGAFFIADSVGSDQILRLIASYAYKVRKNVSNMFHLGEGLVGQAALEGKSILLTNVPSDYIQVSSGLGEAPPLNIMVLPVLFEGEVKAIIELASFMPFSQIHMTFLDQLSESIGVVLNMISANMRTEELLQQSQSLTQELQSQSRELQQQQEELKRSNSELEAQAKSLKASEELLKDQQEELQQINEELEEKASLLAEQNKRVELKNKEVEMARLALEEQAERLAMSSKYKSEFLANMSHELRTPLNSLLILAKLLTDNKEENLNAKQREWAQTIHASGNDLLNLINEVLDLSKVEAGKMDINPTEIPLADIEGYLERSFRPLGNQKNVEFIIARGHGVPEVIVTDGQRLQQILKNLLANAFKFTEEGQVAVHIDVASAELKFENQALVDAATVLSFAVSDTGIGIAKHQQKLIFEAFQQADGTTSRKYGGTGLGLSISREIARLLGGEIRVESVPNEGSTFTLYLPSSYGRTYGEVSQEQGPRPQGGSRMGPQGWDLSYEAEGSPSNNVVVSEPIVDPSIDLMVNELDDDREIIQPGDRAILIVEDDTTFAGILLGMARERGFKGIVALRGDTGLALAREYKPDAVILDIRLPVLNGWTVLDRLKHHRDTRHIPVHIISGDEGRQRGLRLGAMAYAEKPLSKEAIDAAFTQISEFIDSGVRSLLIVEDDETQRQSLVDLIGEDDVVTMAVGTAEEALRELNEKRYDCMVLDLGLPDMTGFDLLERIKNQPDLQALPIIIYTGKDLSKEEETRLKKYAETIIVKDVKSPERLLDETALFLHRVESSLPEPKRRVLEQLHSTDAVFKDRKILVVDDDMRNIYAITSVLENHGMTVLFAENGRDGIDRLMENQDIDLVLMDVMMPEMDGYETMRAVRQIPEFTGLPIIALTAKAMKGDREKCIAAGASDYITKPVDSDQLLSLMRVWLYQ